MRKYLCLCMLVLSLNVFAQRDQSWTYHFQYTQISQSHLAFKAAYSGTNSLNDSSEINAISVTSTLFLGKRVWKGGAIFFTPEMSGGKGLSYAVGVAGALNGETYRIGSSEPQIFIARTYFRQQIQLNNSKYQVIDDDFNQIKETVPVDRINLYIGKFAVNDFFDNNQFSKDPRTQFFNWSVWANGAWDYPANTRGYTIGGVAELIHSGWLLRFSSVAVPKVANHSNMEYVIGKANSETIELQKNINLLKRKGTIRILSSYTASRAPSYRQGIEAIHDCDSSVLNIISGNAESKNYGSVKYGFYLNIEQELTNDIGFFSRVGWNNGQSASWAFTEIDRTFNFGLSIKGNKWGRSNDVIGIANVSNSISSPHRTFLREGGYGFIIGDGKLNYGIENITELYYLTRITKNFELSLDYQLV